MRILFITHRLPCPPDRGCKLRSAAILHWLAQRHDVWCAGFLDSGDTRELQAETHGALQSLRHMCRGVMAADWRPTWAGYKALGGLIAGRTATESYFSSNTLTEATLNWCRQVEFDAVFAFSSGIAPLAARIPARRRVLCMDDLDSRKWQELVPAARWPMRQIYATEARRLARREFEWIDRFDATLMISQREADLVTDSRLRPKIHVIPPMLPSSSAQRELPLRFRQPTGRIVGFIGAMDYQPNIDAACWFVREVWPRIRRQCPDAQFWIVGRSPAKAVTELARPDEIIVTGTVPDIGEYASKMRVHIAPLRVARGVQIKVLSAMAAGRPCVVTSCVAEGLGARAGRDLLVADSAAGIAHAVGGLLEDQEKADAIGRAGRAFLTSIEPDRVMQKVEWLLSGDEAGKRGQAVPGSTESAAVAIEAPALVSAV